MANILIVDDDAASGAALQRALGHHGHTCNVVGGAAQARAALLEQHPAVAVVRAPADSALNLLLQLAGSAPATRVILLAADLPAASVIAAMREGAFDCLGEPLDLDRLARTVDRAVQAANPVAAAVRCADPPPARGTFIGDSPAIQQLAKAIGALTRHDVTVVITGESGTGKELVARALHDLSPRAGEPFVAIHCGAIPATLLESELFGHERGSFTDAHETKIGKFEAAGAGTIFLDEIAEMSLALQVKILRALQERQIERIGGRGPIPVRARILAATHRDLQEQVARGRFREDLLYRLQVASIHLPPLRERTEDIPALAAAFLGRCAAELRKPVLGISHAALARLRAHRWPGNVRELENVLQRAVVMCQGPVIDAPDLAGLSEDGGPSGQGGVPPAEWPRALRAYATLRLDARRDGEPVYEDVLLRAEREIVAAALERCEGNQAAAAQALGISRSMLRKRLLQLSLLPADSSAANPPPHPGSAPR